MDSFDGLLSEIECIKRDDTVRTTGGFSAFLQNRMCQFRHVAPLRDEVVKSVIKDLSDHDVRLEVATEYQIMSSLRRLSLNRLSERVNELVCRVTGSKFPQATWNMCNLLVRKYKAVKRYVGKARESLGCTRAGRISNHTMLECLLRAQGWDHLVKWVRKTHINEHKAIVTQAHRLWKRHKKMNGVNGTGRAGGTVDSCRIRGNPGAIATVCSVAKNTW